MKVTGQRALSKQLKKMPDTVREELEKVTRRSTKRYRNFARRIAPKASGKTIDAITSHVMVNDNGVLGFVNFNTGTKESAIRQVSISYGATRKDRGSMQGYKYIQTTRNFIGDKFQRAIKRAVKIGMEKA